MSSLKTFCVRWLTVIVVGSVVLAPVSQALAHDQSRCPAAGQELTAKR